MAATSAIAAIGAAHGSEFIPAKMFDACAAMPAFAKHSYLVYEIAFFQKVLFLLVYKDIVPIINHTYEIIAFYACYFLNDCCQKM